VKDKFQYNDFRIYGLLFFALSVSLIFLPTPIFAEAQLKITNEGTLYISADNDADKFFALGYGYAKAMPDRLGAKIARDCNYSRHENGQNYNILNGVAYLYRPPAVDFDERGRLLPIPSGKMPTPVMVDMARHFDGTCQDMEEVWNSLSVEQRNHFSNLAAGYNYYFETNWTAGDAVAVKYPFLQNFKGAELNPKILPFEGPGFQSLYEWKTLIEIVQNPPKNYKEAVQLQNSQPIYATASFNSHLNGPSLAKDTLAVNFGSIHVPMYSQGQVVTVAISDEDPITGEVKRTMVGGAVELTLPTIFSKWDELGKGTSLNVVAKNLQIPTIYAIKIPRGSLTQYIDPLSGRSVPYETKIYTFRTGNGKAYTRTVKKVPGFGKVFHIGSDYALTFHKDVQKDLWGLFTHELYTAENTAAAVRKAFQDRQGNPLVSGFTFTAVHVDSHNPISSSTGTAYSVGFVPRFNNPNKVTELILAKRDKILPANVDTQAKGILSLNEIQTILAPGEVGPMVNGNTPLSTVLGHKQQYLHPKNSEISYPLHYGGVTEPFERGHSITGKVLTERLVKKGDVTCDDYFTGVVDSYDNVTLRDSLKIYYSAIEKYGMALVNDSAPKAWIMGTLLDAVMHYWDFQARGDDPLAAVFGVFYYLLDKEISNLQNTDPALAAELKEFLGASVIMAETGSEPSLSFEAAKIITDKIIDSVDTLIQSGWRKLADMQQTCFWSQDDKGYKLECYPFDRGSNGPNANGAGWDPVARKFTRGGGNQFPIFSCYTKDGLKVKYQNNISGWTLGSGPAAHTARNFAQGVWSEFNEFEHVPPAEVIFEKNFGHSRQPVLP